MRPFKLIPAGALAALAGMAFFAAPAWAPFHLILVSEVHSGPGLGAEDFVELQMPETGENVIGGHTLRVYDATGAEALAYMFPVNAPDGQGQRTILIRNSASIAPADYYASGLDLPEAGGAVCFDTFECASWGAFSGSLPSPAGTPAVALDGTGSLTRTIAPGCSTLLQTSDDTNSSTADFSLLAPSPRTNATPPTETECILSVSLAGPGTGRVDGPGISCPPTCTFPYFNGENVGIVASPDAGSTFRGWTACATPAGATCTAGMTVSRSVVAGFDGGPPSGSTPDVPLAPVTPVASAPPAPKKCTKAKKRKAKAKRKRCKHRA